MRISDWSSDVCSSDLCSLLALAGGVIGLALGQALLAALLRASTDVFPVGYPLALDARVLAVTLALSVVTSVLFGLVPAPHATRVDVQAALAGSRPEQRREGTGGVRTCRYWGGR